MKVKYLAHACFLITSKDGVKIITDPYEKGAYGGIHYDEIEEEADIVTISHDHADHNAVHKIKGSPKVIKEPGEYEVKGIKIKGIKTYHDEKGGKERGENIVYVFEIDNFRIAHMGDLGEILSDEKLKQIGKVDIILIPVGGYFTIDAKQATQIIKKIKPKIVIPMHYKTTKCDFPIAPVEDFIKDKDKVIKFGCEVNIEELPENQEIWVLRHAK